MAPKISSHGGAGDRIWPTGAVLPATTLSILPGESHEQGYANISDLFGELPVRRSATDQRRKNERMEPNEKTIPVADD